MVHPTVGKEVEGGWIRLRLVRMTGGAYSLLRVQFEESVRSYHINMKSSIFTKAKTSNLANKNKEPVGIALRSLVSTHRPVSNYRSFWLLLDSQMILSI
jgi:hypothetical protein